MPSKIDNILERHGLHGSNVKVASEGSTVEKAKSIQEKIAEAISEKDDVINKIASGLTDEEAVILKYANFV